MARAQGARSAMAIAFETTYGTPPASGYHKVPFVSSTLSQSQALLDSELLGYGRDPLAPDLDTVMVDGDIVIPMDAASLGFWLKATFGEPTTTGAGPYTHVFNTGNWTLPSLAIETAMPEVPHFAMAAGCKVNQMQFQMQFSGLLTATVGLMGQGETVAGTTGAGTPSAVDLSRFVQRHGAVTRAGSALGNVVSSTLTYSNNLDAIEVIRSDGKRDGFDPSMAGLSGSMVVRFADQTLLSQATAGTPAAFSFTLTKSASESLTILVPRVFLPRPKITVEGAAGVQATFDWQAAQQDDGDPMATFTLINNVEEY